MTNSVKQCAILSMDCLDDFEAYDYLIEAPLAELGWQTHTVSWRKKDVDWQQYDAVIIRTPWDYQDDAPAFIEVLEQIEQSSAHLENSLNIVRWNIDKLYLRELEELGVKLVPTMWKSRVAHQPLTDAKIGAAFRQLQTEQIVVKPRISANADNTFWLTKHNYGQFTAQLNQAFFNRDFMIQPFMPAIITEGEFSLFYFNGQYSHAILKTPKQDDFRVQEEHGGRLSSIEPEASLLEHADICMAAIKRLHDMPLYARVDFVRCPGGFALMEAELIEPSLYFNMDEQSPKRFAHAFAQRMKEVAK